MKFGPVPLSDAEGAILAHGVVLPDRRLKKGHVLIADDIAALSQDGMEEITVAQLDENDIAEDEAAARIAAALSSDLITLKNAFTGRVNMAAATAGIFHAERQAVDRINRISPAITLATLADGAFVEAGRMVATVKIIPFAAARADVEAAESIANAGGVLSVAPTQPHRVGLIATQLPGLKPSTMDKTARVLSDRLVAAGSELIAEERVAHEEQAVAGAITAMKTQCDLIVLFGASAIADRDDVLPAGLERAGGKVAHFGMPVDPGNLMLTGQLGDLPVIGAPGCARSPAENGFDWVLHRLLAGEVVDDDYITGLGVGGLLMEIIDRPQPREG